MTARNILLVAVALGQLSGTTPNPGEPSAWLSPLLQIPIGIVLAWFMIRAEKKMDEQTRAQRMQSVALERNSQALMIAVLSLKHGDGDIAELAAQLKTQCEIAQKHEDSPS